MTLNLRMAWRNLWRHKRRTWLTATAMIFSNVLLVFMISLQFGTYDMMIDNTLQSFSGHAQVQVDGYRDNPKLRDSVPAIEALADELARALPEARGESPDRRHADVPVQVRRRHAVHPVVAHHLAVIGHGDNRG